MKFLKRAIIVVVIFPLVVTMLYGMSRMVWILASEKTITAKVTSVDRTPEHKYIYIKNDWGFIYNDDDPWAFKWNSGTYQGQIEEGHTYQFKVYGIRFPLLSWAPNLLDKPVEIKPN